MRCVRLRWAGLALAVLMASGCESEDGPLFPEADWPDFKFNADARLDADVEPGDGRDAAVDPDASEADATRQADADVDTDAELPDAELPDAAPPLMLRRSAGCGQAEPHRRGGEWIDAMQFSPGAGGVRGFYLTVPANYDAEQPSRLIVGYPGTDWLGGQIRDYLRIEGGRANEIFVYPDPLWRDFGNWGTKGGWLLGPHGFNASGEEDLNFTVELLDHIQDNYCVDLDRVFVTGHSWGGDMAHVVSCFLGDRLRASAPAAANDPYWFRAPDGPVECAGQAAVWTFFGVADDHFNLDPPGTYGDNGRDFWLEKSNCVGVDAAVELDFGPEEDCFDYQGCDVPTRYCQYGPATRHQIPPYFGDAIMAFFRSF